MQDSVTVSVDNETAMKILYCYQNDSVRPLWRANNHIPQKSYDSEPVETTDNKYHRVQIYGEKIKDVAVTTTQETESSLTSYNLDTSETRDNKYHRVQIYAEKVKDTAVTTTQETESQQTNYYKEPSETTDNKHHRGQMYAEKVKDPAITATQETESQQTSYYKEPSETTDNKHHRGQMYAEKVKDPAITATQETESTQKNFYEEPSETTNNKHHGVQMFAEKVKDTAVTATQETASSQTSFYRETFETTDNKHHRGQMHAEKVNGTSLTVTAQIMEGEMADTYMRDCHFCNITVPLRYMEKHRDSLGHKSCLKLARRAMMRVTRHISKEVNANNAERDESIRNNKHYCDVCNLEIDSGSLNCHENSAAHLLFLSKAKLLADLLHLYTENRIDSENVVPEENGSRVVDDYDDRDNTVKVIDMFDSEHSNKENINGTTISKDKVDEPLNILYGTSKDEFTPLNLLNNIIRDKVDTLNMANDNTAEFGIKNVVEPLTLEKDESFDSHKQGAKDKVASLNLQNVTSSTVAVLELKDKVETQGVKSVKSVPTMNKYFILCDCCNVTICKDLLFSHSLSLDHIIKVNQMSSQKYALKTPKSTSMCVRAKFPVTTIEYSNVTNNRITSMCTDASTTATASKVTLDAPIITASKYTPATTSKSTPVTTTTAIKCTNTTTDSTYTPATYKATTSMSTPFTKTSAIKCIPTTNTTTESTHTPATTGKSTPVTTKTAITCVPATNTATNSTYTPATYKANLTSKSAPVTTTATASKYTPTTKKGTNSKSAPATTTTPASKYTPAKNKVITSKSAPVTTTPASKYTPAKNKATTSKSAPVTTTTTASKYTAATNKATNNKSAPVTTTKTAIKFIPPTSTASATVTSATSCATSTLTTSTASLGTTSVNTIISSQPSITTFCDTCKFTLQTVDFYNHLTSFEHKRNLRKRKSDHVFDTEKDCGASHPKKLKDCDSDVEIIETVHEVIVIEDDTPEDAMNKADNTEHIKTKMHNQKISGSCKPKVKTEAQIKLSKSCKSKVKSEAQSFPYYDPEKYCQICKVKFGSPKDKVSHINGARHIRNVKIATTQTSQVNIQNLRLDQSAATVNVERPNSYYPNNNYEWLSESFYRSVDFAMNYYQTNEIYCYLCCMTVGHSNMRQHLNGWKHRGALQSARLRERCYF